MPELVTDPDEDHTVVNPSSSTRLSPPEDNKDPDRVSVLLNEHLYTHLHNLSSSSSTSEPFVLVLLLNQGPAATSQGPAPILMTKTVSIAMSTVHEVRTLVGQCFTQNAIYPD